MIAHVWDEIGCEWHTYDLLDMASPPQRPEPGMMPDPEVINDAVNLLVGASEWRVESSSVAGPIQTIVSRSSRGHLSIIVVDTEA
jgi:hypothetical protein